MSVRQLLLISLLFVMPSLGFAASTMRCNSHLVSLGDTQGKVYQLCGEPSYKNFIGYEERGWYFNKDIHGKYDNERVPLEEWSYQINDRLSYLLLFRGGALKQISSGFTH